MSYHIHIKWHIGDIGYVSDTACDISEYKSIYRTYHILLPGMSFDIEVLLLRLNGTALITIPSLQVTIKTNILAELKHQAPN